MSQTSETNPDAVKGSPRKELFITMLTRDITLIDAISDLVDNCMDGAIKLRGEKKFTGLQVDITILLSIEKSRNFQSKSSLCPINSIYEGLYAVKRKNS